MKISVLLGWHVWFPNYRLPTTCLLRSRKWNVWFRLIYVHPFSNLITCPSNTSIWYNCANFWSGNDFVWRSVRAVNAPVSDRNLIYPIDVYITNIRVWSRTYLICGTEFVIWRYRVRICRFWLIYMEVTLVGPDECLESTLQLGNFETVKF